MSEVVTKVRAVVWRVNNYFFDIEPDDPVDYAGAIIFYGSISAILLTGITVAAVVIV